jgi:hypothetical protein
MNFIEKIIEFLGSIKQRAVDHPNTIVGGGVFGVIGAALLSKVEDLSGCHFATAFANFDWMQIAFYVYAQVHGALSTDANKTLNTVPK